MAFGLWRLEMAASKIIPIRSVNELRNVWRYLQNKLHPDHLDYEIGPVTHDFSHFPDRDFITNVEMGFKHLVRRTRPGRRRRVVAQWQIVTFPPGSCLDDSEHRYARKEIHDAISGGEESASVVHRNRLDGSSDLNRLFGEFAGRPDYPISRRINYVNEWSQLCQVADAVTDELNAMRPELKRPPILTMREAIADLARDEQFDDIIGRLVRLKKRLISTNLKEAVISLGYSVNWDLQHDKMIIRRKGRKGPTRLSISGSLAEIRLRKEKAKQLDEPEFE
jgi:hypothetical protein